MSDKFGFADSPWAHDIAFELADGVPACERVILQAIWKVQDRLNEEYKDGLVTRHYSSGHVEGKFLIDEYGGY